MQLEQCQEALAAAQREYLLLRQKLDGKHVFDLVHALLADLRDMHENVNFIRLADEGVEAG